MSGHEFERKNAKMLTGGEEREMSNRGSQLVILRLALNEVHKSDIRVYTLYIILCSLILC